MGLCLCRFRSVQSAVAEQNEQATRAATGNVNCKELKIFTINGTHVV